MKICWNTLDGIKLTNRGNFAKYKNGKRLVAYKYNDECFYCHEPYFTIKKQNSKYCSKKCSNMSNKKYGSANSNYADGSYCNNGYPSIYKDGKNNKVHRIVAECVLGRKLRKNECVHHIDMNKKNNLNSNLVICDLSYHRLLHHMMAKRWVENILNINIGKTSTCKINVK